MGKLKLSNYTILTQLDKHPDYYFMQHGYTGSISLINQEIHNYLISGNFNKIDQSDLDDFKKKHFLTDKSIREEKDELIKTFNRIHEKLIYNNTYLFIFSYDCNFRCSYCYEQNLQKKGKEWLDSRMSKEQIDNIITILKNEKEPEKLNISFYGGEPLTKDNFEIISYTIEKLREIGIQSVHTITNGYELEYYEEYLGKFLNNFQITLDGPAEIHNKRRPAIGNKKSFK